MNGPNWLDTLSQALTPATYALVMHIATEAAHLGYKAYLVGGPVRDMVLQQPVNDIDIVFEGAAIPLARRLAQTLGGYALTHDRFGTAKWILNDADSPPTHALTQGEALPDFIDLITARRETYDHPAALPTVTFAGIEDDLFRRDFVLNTLALQLNGENKGQLLDPYGGMHDLQTGKIRILHDASFIDDPTRIFRALRFANRLGFQLVPRTRTLLKEALPFIAYLTPDRVRHEVILLFQEPNAVAMLDRLAVWGGFPYVFPEVVWSKTQRAKVRALKKAGESAPDVLLAALLWGASHTVVEAVAERLGIPNDWRVPLLALAALQQDTTLSAPILSNSNLYFRLRKENQQAIEWLVRLTDNKLVKKRLRLFLDDLRHRTSPITGHDLRQRGIPPGKHYQGMLDKVWAAVMDDVVLPENQELLFALLSIP